MSDLITEYARQCVASDELAVVTAERDALRAELAERITDQECMRAQLDSSTRAMNAALFLVADLRHALGDDGKRMQPELLEYARQLVKDAAEVWQPIETAPRDSRPVLVFEPGKSGGIFKAHLVRMMNRKDEWITHGSLHKLRPTHYMPLPQPPGASE